MYPPIWWGSRPTIRSRTVVEIQRKVEVYPPIGGVLVRLLQLFWVRTIGVLVSFLFVRFICSYLDLLPRHKRQNPFWAIATLPQSWCRTTRLFVSLPAEYFRCKPVNKAHGPCAYTGYIRYIYSTWLFELHLKLWYRCNLPGTAKLYQYYLTGPANDWLIYWSFKAIQWSRATTDVLLTNNIASPPMQTA